MSNFILGTVAMADDRQQAVKVELMFDERPNGNQLAEARANASALYRRHYGTWCDKFLQTVKDRSTGRTEHAYGGDRT